MEQTHNSNSAAVLMMLLGEDLAVSVMQYLGEDEVEKLSSAMSRVDGIGGIDRLEQLLDEYEMSRQYPPIS